MCVCVCSNASLSRSLSHSRCCALSLSRLLRSRSRALNMHSFRFVEQAAEHCGALILIPSTQTTHTHTRTRVHTYSRTEHRRRRCARRRRCVLLVWGIFCFVVRRFRFSNCGSSWVRCVALPLRHMCDYNYSKYMYVLCA